MYECVTHLILYTNSIQNKNKLNQLKYDKRGHGNYELGLLQ